MKRVRQLGVGSVAVGLLATAWGLSVSVVASGPAVSPSQLDTRPSRGTEHTVVDAGWGRGPGQVGRSAGEELRGPLSFCVDDRERVWLLDQENGRVLRFEGRTVTAEVPLPAGSSGDDIVVERDRVCVLSLTPRRQVQVYDDEGMRLHAVEIPDALPPVLHVLVDGADILVECPGEWGRTYHQVGSVAGARVPPGIAERQTRTSAPLPRGRGAIASLTSAHDVSLDVERETGGAEARIRARSEKAVRAILDVAGDTRGAVFLTTVTGDENAGAAGNATLTVTRFSPAGEVLASAAVAYTPLTDAVRRIVVSPAGVVYRMDSDASGVRIIRWGLSSAAEGSRR